MAISENEYFRTNIGVLEDYLESDALRKLSKTLRIDKWHPASIFLIYLSFIGIVFTILSMLGLMVWVVFWFYAFFCIILLGFVFSKPENRFNFPLVLIIFSILVFIPSMYGQATLSLMSVDTNLITENLPNAFDTLAENPFENITMYIETFMDVLNWVMFIAFITMGGATIADAFTLDFGSAATRAAYIGLAIAILTLVYGIFAIADVDIKPIWETIGNAWNDFLSGVGLAQLDQSGNTITSPKIIVNGVFQLFPVILTFVMLGVAIAMRKTDYESVLFAKSLTKENYTKVKITTSISIPVIVFVFFMGIYVIGYFLVTADPEIVVNPAITLGFYLFALITLILIGMKFLILNRDMNIKNFLTNTLKWIIFGMIGLWLWFQVFQPIAYQANLADASTGLISLSQQTQFGGVFLEQLFLVAMPETLIFQCFAIGLGNRIYFYFARTRIIEDQIDKLHLKVIDLRQKLDDINVDPESISKANLRRIAKSVAIEKQIIFIEQSIKEKVFEKHPTSNFVIPTLISALIGSFFFSWYHSFRRGISFVDWWQNPMLGMVYFGAGFFLCLVCFFSYPAGIMVHCLNNFFAILMFS